MGKYSIFDIANWFLNKESMTHKRIQKLCYYAYAWDIAIRNGDLIKDCDFEAWVHGPINRFLFNILKGNKLRELSSDDLMVKTKDITDPDDIDFLESVWTTYGEYGGNTLEIMIHNETPWQNARVGLGPLDNCTNTICIEDIRKYYSSIYIDN